MSRQFTFRRPAHFLNRDTFTLAVQGITLFHLNPHIRLILRMLRNIAVQDRVGRIVHPTVAGFRITLHHCPDTFGINISIFIFPTFLEQKNGCDRILSGNGRLAAEAGTADTVLFRSQLHLIVKTQSLWLLGKRHSAVQHGLRVLGPLDRFVHRSEKNRTGGYHFNIDQAENLHTFHACLQTCTPTVIPSFREDRCIRLHHTCHLRHHVGVRPRRTAPVRIGCIADDRICRPQLVKMLRISSDNAGFMYLANDPMIHISKTERHYVLLGTDN